MKRGLVMSIFLCFLFGNVDAQEQNGGLSVRGVVLIEGEDTPLSGAIVKKKGDDKLAVADKIGQFELWLDSGSHILEISFIGFKSKELQVTLPTTDELVIRLEQDEVELGMHEVVSTGYQQLPKERATGSFVQLDQELVDRRVSTGILDRLEDVTSGVIFNRDRFGGGSDPISIRGRSTIFGSAMPLIIVDNIPYDGSLESINPNDVASITVLKDAAAASIWGARAGNGVIVITTKMGKYDQPTTVSITSNLTVVEAPDLFYSPQMEIADFIEVEKVLFDRGYYNGLIGAASKLPLSPAVETFIAENTGGISQAEALRRLEGFKTSDSRRDLRDYFLHRGLNQQYAVNVSGGGERQRFLLSAGFDSNLDNVRPNNMRRVTLQARQDLKLLNDKINFSGGIYFVSSSRESGTDLPVMYPYERLVDEEGISMPIIRDYNTRFLGQAEERGLTDWRYFPMDEIGLSSNKSNLTDIRINTNLKYKFTDSWSSEILYQYWRSLGQQRFHRPEESYFARNLVNRYTQFDDSGELYQAVPQGGVMDLSNGTSRSHNLRIQSVYQNSWSGAHQINGLAGFEIKDMQGASDGSRAYGYDDALGLSIPVDFVTQYRLSHSNGLSRIPSNHSHSGSIDRFVSYYGNFGYEYKSKYLFSASFRKDASNIFGVSTNQKGVPLWSTGVSWVLSEESFYSADWMPYLKLRATFGYNGNVDRSVSALTSARYSNTTNSSPVPGIRYASIVNPPNPELKWERIGITNIGLDFESKNSRIGGSIEFYTKRGVDLIGLMPFPPSSGVTQFRGNYADTYTKGWDVVLNTVNIDKGILWNTNFLFSFLKDEVTRYDTPSAVYQYLGTETTPMEGKPLYAIFSYPWAGLNGDNGLPMGYLNEEPSTEYSQILAATTPEDLVFHGSGRPQVFGGIRNTVAWKGFSLSMNVTFRMDYYFRRASVNYYDLLSGKITHSDYAMRWQEPGDEAKTQIPAMPQSADFSMEDFYSNSSILVERGDHVRLQDIRFGYLTDRSKLSWLPFQKTELYIYVNNIGILWKASDYQLDPDFPSMRPLRSIALGVRLDL
ncbi:SusC/RagA family TonB-linked outer membrane protein [Algoriphagus sp. Y33]|uniref:SusC/RagA family TonB-linked outer membrane protein n=1 Tax=Algoriphagus sp. Y33 TaxID=2772483 RepID=UPI001782D2A0|nr:SusC/RagA family TonB-linked outer membrane protein [Algoriphagus sp. Y33]